MKNRFSDFINGVAQNVIANVVVIVAIPIVGVIYAFSTNNPQIALLVVLIVLVVINILINLLSLEMLNNAQ